MVPTVELNTKVSMPQVGFGVYKVPPEDAADAVRSALAAGYRSIDTATLYRNERGVGHAVNDSALAREDLFVTTKLWNTEHGYDAALRAFDASLAELGLDYVDLYLIHWPVPVQDEYVSTWRALDKIREQGRARAIGVSNFQPAHLRRLHDETGIVPAVNQIELHPYLPQSELRAFHDQHGIVTEAWSPLARAGALFASEVVRAIAVKHGKTPAQVVLRWHLQLGNVVIPKSVTPSRMADNIAVFDFQLDEGDLASIATLESGERLGPDPDTMGI